MSGAAPFLVLQGQAAHDFAVRSSEHHAVAPAGPAEVVIVAVGIAITAVVAFYTFRFFFRPGEASASHIKRRILGADPGGAA